MLQPIIIGGVCMLDELELIQKIKHGNTDAFSQLVKMYEKKAFNFAYRMLSDQQEAEDATQEAFLRTFNKIDTFCGNSSFSTWFFTILNNICLDILRKRSRTISAISINQSTDDEGEFELQVEDDSPGPYEQLQKKTAQEILEAGIELLSDEHRAVIIMRDINGMEYEDIGKILGISLGTVKSRISRARLALRKILEKNKELFL